MNRFDLESFKKIPRNDLLIYLHQYEILKNEIKISDIFDRINKPIYVFCSIIDDLLRLKLIECINYKSSQDKGSFLPESLLNVKIKLTRLGEDYVECKILGYNLDKYDLNDPLDGFKFLNISCSSLSSLYLKSFEEISTQFSNSKIDIINFYFVLTGKRYKENKEKKVFISYSWDNESHKTWVEKIVNVLNNHFKVEFDKNLEIAMSPSNYMKHNILSSDFVLIIFTKEYNSRIDKMGTGVQTEFSLISEDLFRKISFGKYIPILREGNKIESIPKIMQDSIYSDFRNDESYVESLNKIIELISN